MAQPHLTLRWEDELHHATLLRYGASLLEVRVSPPLRANDFFEARIELPDPDAVVEALVEVRAITSQQRDHQHAALRVVRMRPASLALLEEWALHSQPGAPQPEPHSLTPSRDRELQLSGTTTRRSGEGRAAIRAIFRAATCMQIEQPSAPSHTGPELNLVLDADHPHLDVRYRLEAWRRDWRDWLSTGTLHVQLAPPYPRLDTVLDVRLRCPPALDLRCKGTVVNLHARGFGLSLHTEQRCPRPAAQPHRIPAAEPSPSAPSDGAVFWERMRQHTSGNGLLALMLKAQPDPLEGLQGLGRQQRSELEALLADDGNDYLDKADELALSLEGWDWHWPELSELLAESEQPVEDAAAFMVLAAASRQQALQQVREAAHRGQHLRLVHGEPNPCDRCRERGQRPLSPHAWAHAGLPPYHIGCRCELEPVVPPGWAVRYAQDKGPRSAARG